MTIPTPQQISEAAASIAAQRRTETKPCSECGELFTGLIKKTVCDRCKARLKTARHRAKMKLNEELKQ